MFRRSFVLLPLIVLAGVVMPSGAGAEIGPGATQCVVKDDQSVWCWGWPLNAPFPSAVPTKLDGIDDASAVSAGPSSSCALRLSGAVACWGSNGSGQLGDGTNDSSATPVAVSGLSDAIALDLGSEASACAVRATGSVVCWGRNGSGQLGDGTTTDSNVPVTVNGITNAVAVSMAESHTCALLSDRTLRCWGSNSSGQLGDGTNDPSSVPVQVQGLDDVVNFTAGAAGGCALEGSDSVSCWGSNEAGTLGTGRDDPSSNVPVAVPDLDAVESVQSAGYTNCAVLTGGALKCWGVLDHSVFFNGDISLTAPTPQSVPEITDAAYLLDGFYTTCVVRRSHRVTCWGASMFGLLGNGQSPVLAAPQLPVQDLGDATALDSGGMFTCALRATAAINCWGIGPFGPDATSRMSQTSTPASVPGATSVSQFSVGHDHGCAVISGGTVKCLGAGGYGQLGNGAQDDSYLAAVLVDGLSDATSVASGRHHNCALRTGGTVACWGYNGSGQLGDGSGSSASTPQTVTGLAGVTQVSAGGGSSCALLSGGSVSCWGELGASNTPVAVTGVSTATQISVGAGHACAVLADDTVVCWGDNGDYQLGDGTRDDSSTPVAVSGLTDVVKLNAGGNNSCAVLQDGGVRCWGAVTEYLRPSGETAPTLQVSGIAGADDVSAGEQAVCALIDGGTAKCWGIDWYGLGLFGDGDGPVGHGPQRTPADVVGLSGVWTGYPDPPGDEPEEEAPEGGAPPPATTTTTTTTVKPPAVVLPPKRPVVTLRFIGRKLIFRGYTLPTRAGKCPASVRLSVVVGKKSKRIKSLRTRRVGKSCRVTGSVTLSRKLARSRSLKIKLSGRSLRTSSARVTKTPS